VSQCVIWINGFSCCCSVDWLTAACLNVNKMYSVRVLWIPVVLVVAVLHSFDFMNFSHVLNYIVFTDVEHKIQRKIIAWKWKALGEHRPLPRRIWSGCRVWSDVEIWSPDLADFHNLTGTYLCKVTSVLKFGEDVIRFFQRYEPNCGKVPISQCWRVLDPDRDLVADADNFQNLISSSLFTATSLVIFS